MLSLDLATGLAMSERAAKGDAEALTALKVLFPEDEPCLLCDEVADAEGTVALFNDPANPGQIGLSAFRPTANVRVVMAGLMG